MGGSASKAKEQTLTWPIPNGFHPNNMVRIRGSVPQGTKNFNINFQTQNDYNTSDIILHISVRIAEGVIVFNTKDSGKWLGEQKTNTLAIVAGKEFEIIVACEANQFRIAVNGLHFADFKMRRAHTLIKALSIIGVVNVTAVSFEPSKANSKPGGFGTPYPFPR